MGEVAKCEQCGGKLEAVTKLYFDVTGAELGEDGTLRVTDLLVSGLNDTFDGYPAAMEGEFHVQCEECEVEPDWVFADEIYPRIGSFSP